MPTPPPALTPADLGPLLQSTVIALRAELDALPDHALSWHPRPGEWCVKEVVGQLIEAERRGFAGRIRIILDANEVALQGWDQDEVARARRDDAGDARALVGELAALREDSVRLVAGLGPAELARRGIHPKVGPLTIAELLHEWVFHDRNHVRQILDNVQGWAWPHMGNAQRFTTG
jgi:hypothetical protein